ncbi:histone acetyltransferase KAT6A-like isoform X2 [Dreissena polymorpha]|uniref:histone acetyltransferase KAT6A-like isoform X2 n=1 Tax=Dreissena polymorpha TaxID=45954 RepID=UPI0022650C07|nr:histone acetyltransferase KAT6A-like isoform X2 [Dreissena polymorpha]
MAKEGEGGTVRANPTYTKWLLEAINKVKSQKQRPNDERICHAVQQVHKVSKDSLLEQLELAVRDGSVLKVLNKGICSYRDPSNGPPLKPLKVSPGSDLTKYVIRAVRNCDSKGGITLKQIETYVQSVYTVKASDSSLLESLKSAVRMGIIRGKLEQDGKLIKLKEGSVTDNGRLVGDDFSEHTFCFEEENKEICPPCPVCSFCLGDEKKNRDGVPEELISCVDCGNSGHPSCLKFSTELTKNVKKTRWQCIECKTCFFCRKAGREDNMLFCDSCDRGFHMDCCDPPVIKAPKGQWVCNICDPDRGNKKGRTYLVLAEKYKKKHGRSGIPKTPDSGKSPKSKQCCPTPGCDGSGNINGKSRHHRRQYQCPKIPPNQRPPRKKLECSKKMGSDHDSSSDSDCEMQPHTPLPPGVEQEDVDLFNQAQDRAQDALNKLDTGFQEMEDQALHRNPKSAENSTSITGAELLNTSLHHGPSTTSLGSVLTMSMTHTSTTTSAPVGNQNSASGSLAPTSSTSSTASVVPAQGPYPPCIEFGKYEIQTWYSSPYPQEYARLPKLYICEYCLKYMKSRSVLQRHMNKCGLQHPPANEIYRHNGLSVFEVDGNVSKIYCQNLCLLAKLFLDHKTLYYDVEPFLFYALTQNDEEGCHLVGYFSKEKHCQQKYNVSCIMTMPQCQRKGYGRFLIDFSYLLSRREGQSGSPEKPLSDLGRVSYQAYWRSVILEYIANCPSESTITIKGISRQTGMCPQDITQTLHLLNMIKCQNDKVVVMVNRPLVDNHMDKLRNSQRQDLNDDALKWTPLISSQCLLEEEKNTEKELRKMSKLVSSMSHEFGSSPIKSDLDDSYLSPMKDAVGVKDSTPVKTPPSPLTGKAQIRKKRGQKRKLANHFIHADDRKRTKYDSDAEDEDSGDEEDQPKRDSRHVNNKSLTETSMNESLFSPASQIKPRGRGWPKGVPRKKRADDSPAAMVLTGRGRGRGRGSGSGRRPGRPPKKRDEKQVETSMDEQTSDNDQEDNDLRTDHSKYRDRQLPNGELNLSSDTSSSDSESEHETRLPVKNNIVSHNRRSTLKTSAKTESKGGNKVTSENHTSTELKVRKSPIKLERTACTKKSSSPSSTEGVREKLTPEVPVCVPSPSPVLPESCSDFVSDSISDDVPSLTPQMPTPHSVDSFDGPNSIDRAFEEGESKVRATAGANNSCLKTTSDLARNRPRSDVGMDAQDCFGGDDKQINELSEADSSALASSSIVEQMANEDMEHELDDCDDIDNDNSMGDIPSDDNLQDFDSDTSASEALRATENLIAAEINSSMEQPEETTAAANNLTNEPLVQREETMHIDSIASVGSSHSVNVSSVEPPIQQPEPPMPSPRHPHPSPHNIVSPHHPSPHQPGPSPHLPSPHHTMSPHHTLSPHPNHVSPQCNQMNNQMFSPNQQMNNLNSSNMSSNRYGNEIDVSQLAGLESPTSMSSTELQNTSGDGSLQQHRQQQSLGASITSLLADCAQQHPQQQLFTNNHFTNNPVQISYCATSYMDTVNPALIGNSCGAYMPIMTSTQAAMNFMSPNNFSQVLLQQQPPQQNQTQRLSHNNTPCPSNVRQGNATGFDNRHNSCSLAKLQQMTNGIMDIIPENQQMTPPPQLTPPPSVSSMSTPTSMMRAMQTPNPVQQTMQQQQQQQQYQQQRQYQQSSRQKSSSSSKQKNTNVNIGSNINMGPNVPFSPNVAIQPNTNMLPRYNIMDPYRMQQPMLNTSYITANPSFINQLRQPNLPMQMSLQMNMNPINSINSINTMNHMNMNPQQHFQQQAFQPPQSNNVYTYGYINGGLQNPLNMNMRR